MDESKPTKRCAACGTIKPVGEFHRNRAARDGLIASCKACNKVRRALASEETKAKRRKANVEYMRLYRERLGDEVARRQREFAKANPELLREYRRRFRERHPERLREYQARYYRNNPDVFWRSVQRRRARLLGSMTGPVDLKALWTGVCGICGEGIDALLIHPDPMSRSVDHITPLSKGGAHIQSNLQWAHLICNLRKSTK